MPEICRLDATEMARRIRRKELSSREVLEAHLRQIERVNPIVNAIVTLVPDQALDRARELDEAAAHNDFAGPLHGLPVAHKDLAATKGIRTTFGSPLFGDFVPLANDLIIDRISKPALSPSGRPTRRNSGRDRKLLILSSAQRGIPGIYREPAAEAAAGRLWPLPAG